ncbi:MAG: FkbM family methyltransferase [Candidatus Bilamarchaeaceae archaeon]
MEEYEVELINKDGKALKLTRAKYSELCDSLRNNLKKIFSLIVNKRRLDSAYHLAAYGIKARLRMREKKHHLKNVYELLMELPGDFALEAVRIKNEKKSMTFKTGADPRSVFNHIKEVIIDNQYAVSEDMLRDKTVIDAGANTGTFSIFAAALGAKKIYAFEPIKETYEQLKQNIALNKLENRIVAVNKGLGERNKTVLITYETAEGGGVISNTQDNDKVQRCEITPLDQFVKENDVVVDFIKCDIEGYEKELIRGAEKTIKEFGPIIDISAYHKKEDKEEIPRLIRNIRSDYKYRLNRIHEEDFIFWIE